MKTCDVCGAEFVPTNHQSKRCSDDCRKKAYNASGKKWRDANPDKRAAKSARAYARYRATKTFDERKNDTLRRKYGITLAEYDAMLTVQGGSCAICRGPQTPGRAFAVDHDHACCSGERSCGKCVRGLLCQGCNLALGGMQDDPERLRAAAEYLSIRTFHEAVEKR